MDKKQENKQINKLLSIKHESEAIVKFLSWLFEKKEVILAIINKEELIFFNEADKLAYNKLDNELEKKLYIFNQTSKFEYAQKIMKFNYQLENLLAEYFDIDLNELEKEKLNILKSF